MPTRSTAVTAILLAVLQFVLTLTQNALGTLGMAGALLAGAVFWVSALIGVSALTALYGHLVEGRPV